MELKVVCHCGQKYKFDVEPVNGQMPITVSCPLCGLDGTNLANNMLAQMPVAAAVVATPMPPIPPPVPAGASLQSAGLRINREVAAPPVIAAPAAIAAAPAVPRGRPVPSMIGPAPAVPKYLQDNKAIMNNSFMMGVLGAGLGAVVDVAVVVGLRIFCGSIFVVFGMLLVTALGIAMGSIIGFGARLLYRGTDFALGAVCAVVAFFTLGVTFFLLFGIIGMAFSIMALLVGTAVAFKIAS
jgi:hypothetical protein